MTRRPRASMLAFACCGAIALSCGTAGSDGPAGGSGNDAGGSAPNGDDAGKLPDPSGDAGPVAPPPPTCDAPIQAADVSHPTTVVGHGAGTCTEQALRDALAKGGVVTFDCGGAATVAITSELPLSTTVDTVLDGGGLVTLDGGDRTRILHYESANFRATKTKVTLQHLAFAHGKASGTPIPQAPPPCSQGFGTDGGGGAVMMRDGILHVIDCTFTSNHAASPGPDVAGGAIYAIGALDVTIAGSRFVQNAASNGGAVGSLFSNLTLANDTFVDNAATGTGANSIDTGKCSADGGEVGNGGNGGAVVMDGGEDFAVLVCGATFTRNTAGALGGAIFRTPDLARQKTTLDRSTFDANTAKGGGALYFHHSDLTVVGSTFSGNSAEGAGAIQADDTTFAFTNDTFAGNAATTSLGGAISLFGNGGTIASCTFANNHADAGSGKFAAAIAGGTALTITNTIFANNTSQDCGAPMTCADGSSGGAANVQWPQSHVVCTDPDPPCAAGTAFGDPMLGALGDHGGPTATLVPAAGSAANGGGKGCPATDQRGQPRKTPDGCTVGAVEATP